MFYFLWTKKLGLMRLKLHIKQDAEPKSIYDIINSETYIFIAAVNYTKAERDLQMMRLCSFLECIETALNILRDKEGILWVK